jgi:hypothetical protein
LANPSSAGASSSLSSSSSERNCSKTFQSLSVKDN